VNIVAFAGIGLNLCSITIGAALPGFVIKKDESTIEDVRNLLFWEAIIISVPLILLMIFFKNNPEKPPSKIANAIMKKAPIRYRELIKELFSNRDYMRLMIAMVFGFGTLSALLLILDQALKGLGYENSGTITSLVILSALIGGLIGTLYFSYLLRKTKAYRLLSGLSTLFSLCRHFGWILDVFDSHVWFLL